jgi:hypothetical protein
MIYKILVVPLIHKILTKNFLHITILIFRDMTSGFRKWGQTVYAITFLQSSKIIDFLKLIDHVKRPISGVIV